MSTLVQLHRADTKIAFRTGVAELLTLELELADDLWVRVVQFAPEELWAVQAQVRAKLGDGEFLGVPCYCAVGDGQIALFPGAARAYWVRLTYRPFAS